MAESKTSLGRIGPSPRFMDFHRRFNQARLILDIQETDATIVGLDGSPPAGQGEMLFDKLGKMRCARTRSINFGMRMPKD